MKCGLFNQNMNSLRISYCGLVWIRIVICGVIWVLFSIWMKWKPIGFVHRCDYKLVGFSHFNGSHAHNNSIVEEFFCLFFQTNISFTHFQSRTLVYHNLPFWLVRWPYIWMAGFLYLLLFARPLCIFIDCFLCVYVITYKSKWHDSVAIQCCC